MGVVIPGMGGKVKVISVMGGGAGVMGDGGRVCVVVVEVCKGVVRGGGGCGVLPGEGGRECGVGGKDPLCFKLGLSLSPFTPSPSPGIPSLPHSPRDVRGTVDGTGGLGDLPAGVKFL